MRLEILMGTQKSHFAYRLAWENTSSERIPFLPLHRRDLVSAEQGNKTFIGNRINWKKFEVMGEVIVGIQKSQGTPYAIIARDEDIQRLVLESRITKDDDVSTSLFLSPPSLLLPHDPGTALTCGPTPIDQPDCNVLLRFQRLGLIHECKELYERSIQLEAPGGSENTTKKKFGWFQR